MKILLHDEKTLLMSEVFNSVVFETDDGQLLAVYMRDGGFEIGASHRDNKKGTKWFFVKDKKMEQIDF